MAMAKSEKAMDSASAESEAARKIDIGIRATSTMNHLWMGISQTAATTRAK